VQPGRDSAQVRGIADELAGERGYEIELDAE